MCTTDEGTAPSHTPQVLTQAMATESSQGSPTPLFKLLESNPKDKCIHYTVIPLEADQPDHWPPDERRGLSASGEAKCTQQGGHPEQCVCDTLEIALDVEVRSIKVRFHSD